MPYSSRYTGYRRSFRRFGGRRIMQSFRRRFRGGLRGVSRIGALTRSVRALQQHARRVGVPERKWVDSINKDFLQPTGGPLNEIVDIASNFATGAGASGPGSPGSILGNKVKIESIHLNGEFHLSGTINAGGTSMRIVVYEDMDPDGSVAAPGDIFYVDSTLSIPGVQTYSMRNMSNSSRFFVISDVRFTLSAEGKTSYVYSKHLEIGRTVQYATNGSGNVVAGTVGTNRTFGYLLILDESSANQVTYSVATRVRYSDN